MNLISKFHVVCTSNQHACAEELIESIHPYILAGSTHPISICSINVKWHLTDCFFPMRYNTRGTHIFKDTLCKIFYLFIYLFLLIQILRENTICFWKFVTERPLYRCKIFLFTKTPLFVTFASPDAHSVLRKLKPYTRVYFMSIPLPLPGAITNCALKTKMDWK